MVFQWWARLVCIFKNDVGYCNFVKPKVSQKRCKKDIKNKKN